MQTVTGVRETATVVSVGGGQVKVSVVKNERCDSCRACAFGKKNEIVLAAYADCEVRVGQSVQVVMPEKKPLTASVLLFIVPLIAFAIGLIAGMPLGEWGMLGIGVAVFALSFVPLWIIDRKLSRSKKYMPRIIEGSGLVGSGEEQNV